MALPAVDFNMMADLKTRMKAFTTRFDQFILAGREQLRKEHDAYVAGMAEDRSTQRAHQQAIERTREEQAALEDTLTQEREEVEAVQANIDEFSTKRAAMVTLRTSLEAQVQAAQDVLTKRREAVAARRLDLARQNAQNRPELDAWETQLGLKIDAAGTDKLRFTYTHVNDRDAATPHFFIVNLADPVYAVDECHPALPDLDRLVADLNRTRDFSTFLKRTRQAFKRLHVAA